MRATTERLEIKLTNAEMFAQLMKANEYTVRTLAEAVKHELIKKHSKATISSATIGHLRSGKRNTVNHDVAHAIAKLFKLPHDALFTAKPITVTRDVPPTRK
ncbi:hypothetical protein [Arthrobacter bambusae]|uniref:hypothetical protein n=1 Tax=Arthrobacter bambusae TaxID=1338426 RepID=UPI002785D74A|nr:hypothetical protein [Arthrobacter bambusae]MDQ0241246.1 ribosomal protein L18 [Arthrobacter bambusae]